MVATASSLEHVTTVLSALTLICALVAIQRESFLEGKYTFFLKTDLKLVTVLWYFDFRDITM